MAEGFGLLERRLAAIIQTRHQGQEQAITVRELQRQLLISGRQIRAALARLVVVHHLPIASTVHPPYGFYLITTEAEARECLAQYWSRVEELAKRTKILAAVVKKQFGVEIQLELRFDASADR